MDTVNTRPIISKTEEKKTILYFKNNNDLGIIVT